MTASRATAAGGRSPDAAHEHAGSTTPSLDEAPRIQDETSGDHEAPRIHGETSGDHEAPRIHGETPRDRADLRRLLAKYATLESLRRARERGEPIPEKAVFQALAAELPGALHELDRLPMSEITARRLALESALAGGPVAPWMPAMALYHALYRAALYTKARLPRKHPVVRQDTLDHGLAPVGGARALTRPGPLSAEQASALARAASRHASIEISADFIASVAAPPAGRIGSVVLAEVASRTGEAAGPLLRAMFPTRRDLTTKDLEKG